MPYVVPFKSGLVYKLKELPQNDHFDFYLWARQALGLPGSLFGWTSWFQRAVQSNTREKTDRFKQSGAASGQ
jgi:hypothetical protein